MKTSLYVRSYGGVLPRNCIVTGYLCSLPWWLTGSDETAAQGYRGAMTTPVVLVHGWGGSFESTWQRSGFTELLRDASRPVIGVDLLGHGTAPKPHDPEAYADLGARVLDAMPSGSPWAR